VAPAFSRTFVARAVTALLLLAASVLPAVVDLASTAHIDATSLPASMAHALGTDDIGRDVLARTLVGGRMSLSIACAAALLSTCAGIALGIAAAIGSDRGGAFVVVDIAIERTIDMTVSLPFVPLLVAFVAWSQSARGPLTLILWLSVTSWMSTARLVRASALASMASDAALAARGMGAGTWHLVRFHAWHGIARTAAVVVAIDIAHNILSEAALSVLGVGLSADVPTWGNQLRAATSTGAPLLSIAAPAVCLVATVAWLQHVSDRLRESLSRTTTVA
jgi:ABC-type dipeptide/oligopeptide/nickel transport system permease subunit